MREFQNRLGRDMVHVAVSSLCVAALVLGFSFEAAPPWSTLGGFCAGFLAWAAVCYAVVGSRILREEFHEQEN